MIPPHPFRAGAAAAVILCLTAMAARAQYFTGPHGPGGSWNLYQVVTVPSSFPAARTAAKNKSASATGLPGLSSTLTGHLVQIGSEDENSFVAAIATLTPGAGTSNLWLGLNDLDPPDGPGEQGSGRLVWQWADSADQIDAGDFQAWAPGEPNNAGGVEDGGEMRTDGAWNDANVTGLKRYVIEWELRAAAPIAGAAQFPVYYTGPYGAGGKWNLYRMVLRGDTWDNARAAARQSSAASTGLAGVAGPAFESLKGHLVSLNSEAEHHFVYQAMVFGGLNSAGYWTGATDRLAEGGDGTGLDPLAGWRWVDETPALRGLDYHRFPRHPFFAEEEPSHSGDGEDVVEVGGAGFWNDISSASVNLRRFVVEWNTELDSPVEGAARLAPMLSGTRTFSGAAGTGQWNVKGTVFSSQPTALTSILAALRYVNNPPPTGSTKEVTTPVLNNTDSNPATNTAGRSTNGLFWPRQPLANDTPNVDDNYYIVNARTRIQCEAGKVYTINVHSDDGFYLRLSGGGGGGNNKATFHKIGGLGGIDESDASAIYFAYGTSDASTRGVFTVSADGVYEVEYVGFDATGGSFQEVSWAPVEALNDWDTGEWRLMGGTPSGSPLLPPAGQLNCPPGTAQSWGTRAAVSATPLDSIPQAVSAIQSASNAVTQEFPVINYNDPENPGNRFRFSGDFPLPGNTAADDNQLVVAARTQFQVPAAGPYTLCVRADDGFALRVAGQKWAGRAANFTTTTPASLSNGFIDPLDPSTLHWLASSDANARAVIHFPAPGSYGLEFLHYEGTGGGGAEIYYAPGICVSDPDSTDWRLIGNPDTYQPLLPYSLPGAMEGMEGAWGLRVLEPATVNVTDLSSAVAALEENAGINHWDTVPVLNHIATASPGTGGAFGGDWELPGIGDTNNSHLAIHARATVLAPATGLYTFIGRSGDGWALRFRNGYWLDRVGAGIDPADPSTLIHNVTGTPDAVNDFRGGGLIFLTEGAHEADFVTFQDQRDTQFELYAAAGNLVNTPDTAAIGGANLGDAGPAAPWRLVGYQSQGVIPRLGVTAPWSVKQTRPQSASLPGSGVEGALAWLALPSAVNGATTTTHSMINFNDPGFGGPGSIVNDAPIPRNNSGAAADDNNYASLMESVIRAPVDAFYSIGWQGDDGGFLEFLAPSFPVTFERLTANAMLGSTIQNSSDGTPRGRIQFNGGGANTRTIGEIFLPAGDYPVRALWFEGVGNSHFEILAAAAGQQYNLISTTSGSGPAGPADSPGLALGAMQPPGKAIRILDLTFPASRLLSLTWQSNPGRTYQIQKSLNLVHWQNLTPLVPSGGATTIWTSPTPLPAQETRVFFRVREL